MLTVGFDLDMTLIDTRPGFAETLRALGAEYGVEFEVSELVEMLGPPLDHLLAPYLPSDQIPAAVDRFRELYPGTAIKPVPVLPGAHEAIEAVHRLGGRVVVITGKFEPNARLHLDHLNLQADRLYGGVWGPGKGNALTTEAADMYVGDHVHDVNGARAAGVLSVSVPTGPCTSAELREAGTDVVCADLKEFKSWLAQGNY